MNLRNRLLFLLLLLPAGVAAAPDNQTQPAAETAPRDFGDYFYLQRKYNLAGGEFEKALVQARNSERPTEMLRAKLALSLMRQRKYNESLRHLDERHPFALLFLRMYASLRVGYIDTVRRDREYARTNASLRPRQKDLVDLLAGTVLLERAQYEAAWEHYDRLQKETQDEEVRAVAGGVLTSMKAFEDRPRKSQWLAGFFSALLPGSGQWYAGHEVDGLVAFFFNAFFIGSAVALYDLERAADRPHTASGVFGVVGLFFYITNIAGAVASARRYNIYQERVFQQEVRDRFFNADFVERNSGVQFRMKF